jgi:hypothetical protein
MMWERYRLVRLTIAERVQAAEAERFAARVSRSSSRPSDSETVPQPPADKAAERRSRRADGGRAAWERWRAVE